MFLRNLIFEIERTRKIKKRPRILHFLNSASEIESVHHLEPEIHVLASSKSSDNRFEDIEQGEIPYDDGVFDLVIVSKTSSASKTNETINELLRVTAQEGILILLPPFETLTHNTLRNIIVENGGTEPDVAADKREYKLIRRESIAPFLSLLDPVGESTAVLQKLAFENDTAAIVTTSYPWLCGTRKKGLSEKKIPTADFRKPGSSSTEPLLSVVCLSYNHERFITDALNGFVSQITTYPYEIIIADDCSGDATRSIIEQFRNKYKNIKFLSNDKNLGPIRNAKRAFEAAKGKYIAVCDGDDYWTDQRKLEKQISFLELNTEYSIVFGSVQAHRETQVDHNYSGGVKFDLERNQLISAPPINTLTTCFRNIFKPVPKELLMVGAGDMFLWSLLGHHGRGKYLPGVLPSVYRIHKDGIHSGVSRAKQYLMRLQTYYALHVFYQRLGSQDLANYFLGQLALDGKNVLLQAGQTKGIQMLYELPNVIAEQVGGDFDIPTRALSEVLYRVIKDNSNL